VFNPKADCGGSMPMKQPDGRQLFLKILFPALVLLLSLLMRSAFAADLPTLEKESNRIVLWFVYSLELIGVSIIILGVVISFYYFLVDSLARRDLELGYHDFRAKLGRAILLGLEFLVAADIINTVAIDPTLENLGILAIIISIRVFLSFALEVEIEGRWPWQRGSRP
jgi:uncharacterized membrane protein